MSEKIISMQNNNYEKIIIKIVFIIILFFSFTLPQIGFTANNTEEAPASVGFSILDPEKAASAIADDPGVELQVPIFGYTTAKNIGEYVLKIFGYALYIIVPLAVVVIMWGGVLWTISGGNPKMAQKAKSYITSAVLGVVLASLSYLILSLIGLNELKNPSVQKIMGISTINPELYNLIIQDVTMGGGGGSGGSYADSGANFSNPELLAMGKEIAKSLGIDPCVVVTKFKMESAGKPNAIGHDALASGTEANRKKTADCKCPKETIQNTDDLGLDWRFSHGIGLGQLTFFPKGYKYHESCNNNATVVSRMFAGMCFTPKMALSPRANIEASLKLWKSKFNGSDYQSAFARYNGGGARAAAYGAKAIGIFNNCKATGGGN